MVAMVDTQKRLIAILRGIEPEEVAPIIHRLIDCGFRAIEIPLNSPRPFESIANAARIMKGRLGEDAMIGAGTVLRSKDVEATAHAGGNFIVSPNVNAAVIQKTKQFGLSSFPGVFTATEAFAALEAGADALKLFPAAQLGPDGLSALGAVIPSDVPVFAVGGVGPAEFAAYQKAGAYGFGLGSALYKIGMNADAIEKTALAAMRAMSDTYQG